MPVSSVFNSPNGESSSNIVASMDPFSAQSVARVVMKNVPPTLIVSGGRPALPVRARFDGACMCASDTRLIDTAVPAV